jgi:glutamate synthase (ferredoxin)
MSDQERAFYEDHSCLLEPWDGPASIDFSAGSVVGAVLDRNGLRPSRYLITDDDLVVMASETGVLDVAPEKIKGKRRLQPGRMLLIDTEAGEIVDDEALKADVAGARPYRRWLARHLVTVDQLPDTPPTDAPTSGQQRATADLTQLQQAFGYTFEDLRVIMAPMADKGVEPVGSMGDDTPLAVLSDKPQPLYNYFKQLFAQVTNPPIDAIREELIVATEAMLGSEGNLLAAEPQDCRRLKLQHPILTGDQLARIRRSRLPGLQAETLSILFPVEQGASGLEAALRSLGQAADDAIERGATLLILSDRGLDRRQAAIPALLATAGLHHHLLRRGLRTRASLLVETGEAREVHHFATLIGYGADAVNPYLALATVDSLLEKELVTEISPAEARRKYVKAIVKGVVKVISKMGISTIQSYHGAQIFEAVGLHPELVERYFTGTPSRIGGARLDVLAREVAMRHEHAFHPRPANGHALPTGGRYQWREDGEHHLLDPATVHLLQHAVRSGDYAAFQKYAARVNDHTRRLCTLRGLLRIKEAAEPIPLQEVEPVETIVRRFKTGAMSYGSIGLEAHQTLAIAMNRLGGKSNTGEGGEDPARYREMPGGDSRNSAIKQVASGRFGVTGEHDRGRSAHTRT